MARGCSARCYMSSASKARCHCPCGGSNHGSGFPMTGGGGAVARSYVPALGSGDGGRVHYPFSRPAGQPWTDEELEAGAAFEDEDEEASWYAARDSSPQDTALTNAAEWYEREDEAMGAGWRADDGSPPQFGSAEEFAAWLSQRPEGGGNVWVADPAEAGDVYNVAVYTSTPQDVAQVNGLVGYHFRGRMGMGGEFYPEQEAEPSERQQQVFTYFADCTKSPSDDYMAHLTDGTLEDYMENGTPVRKTDKAGAGTAGTRRYAGVGSGYYIAYSGASFTCLRCGEFAKPNQPCPKCGNVAYPLDEDGDSSSNVEVVVAGGAGTGYKVNPTPEVRAGHSNPNTPAGREAMARNGEVPAVSVTDERGQEWYVEYTNPPATRSVIVTHDYNPDSIDFDYYRVSGEGRECRAEALRGRLTNSPCPEEEGGDCPHRKMVRAAREQGAIVHCPVCGRWMNSAVGCLHCQVEGDEARGEAAPVSATAEAGAAAPAPLIPSPPTKGGRVDPAVVERLAEDISWAMRGRQFGGGGWYEHDDGSWRGDEGDEERGWGARGLAQDDWRRPITQEGKAVIAKRHLAQVTPSVRQQFGGLAEGMVWNRYDAARANHVIGLLEKEEQERGWYQAGEDLSDGEIKYTAETDYKDSIEHWYDANEMRLTTYGLAHEVELHKRELDRYYPHLAEQWLGEQGGWGRVHLGRAMARAASRAHDQAYDESWHADFRDKYEGEMQGYARSRAEEIAFSHPGQGAGEAADEAFGDWEHENGVGELPGTIRDELKESFTAEFHPTFDDEVQRIVEEKREELHDAAYQKAEARATSDAEYGYPDSDLSDTARDWWEQSGYDAQLEAQGFSKEQREELADSAADHYMDTYDEEFESSVQVKADNAAGEGGDDAERNLARYRGEDGDEVAEKLWQDSRWAMGDLREGSEGHQRVHDSYTAAAAARWRELGGEDTGDQEDEEGNYEGDEDE